MKDWGFFVVFLFFKKKQMEFNICKYCGAKDGKAGLLISSPSLKIKYACQNCYDTLSTKVLTIYTHLNRTEEEINKTLNLLK
jgi:hypothetical protein